MKFKEIELLLFLSQNDNFYRVAFAFRLKHAKKLKDFTREL